MTIWSSSTIANVFKTLQPEGFESLVLPASPLLGRMKKWNKFYGPSKQLDWLVQLGGQASATFATAQANAGVPTHQKPSVTRGKLYTVRQLNNEDVEASQNNMGAVVELLKHARDDAFEELRVSAGQIIWGNGTGAIGRISSGSNVTTASITLADITQAINFKVGGVYNTFTAGDAAVNAGDCVLTGVDEETGVLTMATHWDDTSTGVATGDYLVPKGNYLTVPKGVFGWIPLTLPSVGGGDSWFGVDRGGSVAMCGQRKAYTEGSLDEMLLDSLSLHRGRHDALYLNPIDWGNLSKQSTNWQRINKNAIGSNGKEIASIAYQAIVLNGPKGAVNVYADQNCPRKTALLTAEDSWEIWALGEMFKLITGGMGEGGAMPLATSDGVELRFGGYWQPTCKRPRDSMVITWTQD